MTLKFANKMSWKSRSAIIVISHFGYLCKFYKYPLNFTIFSEEENSYHHRYITKESVSKRKTNDKDQLILQKLADNTSIKNYTMKRQRSRMERNLDLESENLGSHVAVCQEKLSKSKRQREGSMSFQYHIRAQSYPKITFIRLVIY